MPFLFSLGVSVRDAEPMGDGGRRHPIGDGELAENVGDVQRGRLRADEKRLRRSDGWSDPSPPGPEALTSNNGRFQDQMSRVSLDDLGGIPSPTQQHVKPQATCTELAG